MIVEITDTAKDMIKKVLDENVGKYLRIIIAGVG